MNELLATQQKANNRLINIEDLTEEDLDKIKKHYKHLADLAKTAEDQTSPDRCHPTGATRPVAPVGWYDLFRTGNKKHMKQLLILLLAGFLFSCGSNEREHSNDVKVNPEDTSFTSYPPGNTPVPPTVETAADSTRSAADSLNRPH